MERLGLRVKDIGVLHPLGAAVSVVIQAPTLAALTDIEPKLTAGLNGNPAHYEGLFFQLQLPDGTVVAANSNALRSGTARLWINPALHVDLGTRHG